MENFEKNNLLSNLRELKREKERRRKAKEIAYNDFYDFKNRYEQMLAQKYNNFKSAELQFNEICSFENEICEIMKSNETL